jgi:purine-binding chemotaxis protein CheW
MSESVDVVTFNADHGLYAVPVSRVQEILDLRPVAAMPNAPAHLLGIIDLRGANIPVVDLRCLLGRPAAEDTAQSRILVVQVVHGEGRAVIGVKTDRVIEVTLLDEPELRPLHEAELLRWSGSAIAGIGRCKGEVVSVLDLDRLFARVDLADAVGNLPEAALAEVA